ncbi:type II toxin-antitoxin system VapC family toxin [Microbacterium thalassium]|uniref:PIN domain nuclease of toxin-antitoxin system n=1 Tax=Microbacterium thalassium TaxID=362649 RepID=A0A7X0FS59_9MICO|nr:type II toxin-antitoxin system VapC family toxin [Microbacterium thalassium]MBB6392691.1 PIN domain nuclease of toxin-antitoxin system [Microbacterium thalassium]GLK23078.1 twitching motility protein PilT [Microbacterium thalassium]
MRILLDTHLVLWWLADAPELSPRHRALIEDGSNEVLVSSVSVAEIAIKASLGKLDAPAGLVDALRTSGFGELDFIAAHAEVLRGLPWHHRDPFDRMLVAQALVEGLLLLTVDSRVRAYFVE